MHRIVSSILVAAFLAATAAGAIAQQQAPGPRGDRPSEEQRAAVMKKMDAVRIARLTETLKLDEKTAAAFIPAITAMEQKRRDLMKENHEIMREMRILLNASPPDEGKLKASIGKIDKNRQEIANQRNKEFDAARGKLTVVQMARYIIFNQEFQQEMRGMVEGARGGRTGRNPDGRRPGQGMAPGRGPGQGPGMAGSPPESK
ncbi:MAG: periplasmic heavy metal sensor [Nitrospirota bacterium]